MDFSLAEKLAVVKAIDEVIKVDGQVKTEEINFLSQLMNVLKFDKDFVEEARQISAEDCLNVLKVMTDKKKNALAVLLNEMANADGVFKEDEYRLIFNLLMEVGINIDPHEN
jgi:uncharacterized tellurite resistance protein B-like protein